MPAGSGHTGQRILCKERKKEIMSCAKERFHLMKHLTNNLSSFTAPEELTSNERRKEAQNMMRILMYFPSEGKKKVICSNSCAFPFIRLKVLGPTPQMQSICFEIGGVVVEEPCGAVVIAG